MASFGFQVVAGLLLSATPALAGVPNIFSRSAKVCTAPLTSCGTTTSTDLCCFNSPGGQLLQTQFWDTSPSDGPTNAWTIHGLWPDHCDGTFDESCDSSRDYTGISSILTAAGKTALLSDMNTFWTNDPDDGTNEEFWEHEWATHGTCISTLDTTCYTSYKLHDELIDFLQTTVNLYKTLNSFEFLSAAGIVPSTTQTYTLAAINAALKAGFGFVPTVNCASGALNQIWYSFHVTGSVQLGTFVPIAGVGQGTSSCAATGIKYLPKTGSAVPTTTAPGGSTPTGTTGTVSGAGFWEGSSGGCLISAGAWFVGGTCATYQAVASGSGFTLTSSKGPCGVVGTTFTCATGTSQTVFTAIGGLLAFNGATTFHAAAIPTGQVQETVSTSTGSVSVTFTWSPQ